MVADDIKAYKEIKESLDQIKQTLDADIAALKNVIVRKDADIQHYEEKLQQAAHSIEGNRQLVNKLLGDLSKLQNDIEWYKRTYEQRSFLGTVKEKIFRKRWKQQKRR
jgi:chromosome segregation ATPase